MRTVTEPLTLPLGSFSLLTVATNAALDAGDELGDGGDGGVERLDLELDVAGADDDAAGGGLGVRRLRGLVGLGGLEALRRPSWARSDCRRAGGNDGT